MQLINTSTSCNESYPSDCARSEEVEQAVTERLKSVEAAVTFTKQHIEPVLKEQDPTKQEELDIILL